MWRSHLFNLLKRAALRAVPMGGSTVVGIVVIGILGLVAGYGFTVLFEWWRGGRTVASLKAALKSWTPWAGGICGVIFCWLVLVLWQIPVTIYQDHQDLVKRLGDTGKQNGDLETENKKLKSNCTSISTSNRPLVSPRQAIINLADRMLKFDSARVPPKDATPEELDKYNRETFRQFSNSLLPQLYAAIKELHQRDIADSKYLETWTNDVADHRAVGFIKSISQRLKELSVRLPDK